MKDIFQLLFKKYNHNAIPLKEKAIVDSWYQKQIEDLGEAPNEQRAQEDIWQELMQRIQHKSRIKRLRVWKWGAAAMLCISFGIAIYCTTFNTSESINIAAIQPATRHAMISMGGSQEREITDLKGSLTVTKGDKIERVKLSAPKGATFDFVLPDGTKVFLNSDSKISYPSKFIGTNRQVKLEGEAYFEVAHNRAKPFIVKTEAGTVRVLGTKFNVRAYADMKDNLVSLVTGSVQLSNRFTNTLLKPGEMAAIQKDAKTIHVQNINQTDPLAWKSGYFKFDNTAVSELILELERWYNVRFDLSQLKKDIKLSGRIRRDRNLKVTLDLLSTTDEIHFETKGQFIAIKNN